MPRPVSRRRVLHLAAGLGCSLLVPGVARAANVREITGKVFVNKHRATLDSVIRAGDLVTTSHDGRISFTVAGDAFLLKQRTSLEVGDAGNPLIDTLRLLTGKLLSVFETGRDRRIVTATATIGVRGTACFLNAQPRSMYFCNCYGRTVLSAQGIEETFEATHHNAHQLDFDGEKFMGMRVMKVIDHSDDELRQLEVYVGRVPQFDL